MADLRRRPEPPPGAPRIEMKPGLANETLRELAPLLAEIGAELPPASRVRLEEQARLDAVLEGRQRE